MKKYYSMILGLFLFASVVRAQEQKETYAADITENVVITGESPSSTQMKKEKKKKETSKKKELYCSFIGKDEVYARSKGDIKVSLYEAEDYRRSVAKKLNILPSAVFIISAQPGGSYGVVYEVCAGGIYYKTVRGFLKMGG
ncbi:hypothetical protein [Myroides sp. WP-1]|uniref:hypothetical protein n=1 Tax=Myroides sp. WP-1 TaxID=2759944 RepID=UPI0015FD63AC|nr:hypothetical protein [Myroides sp. WP-1]MBB1140264.1 hypothetical protein [Myroides sp. WP-1]